MERDICKIVESAGGIVKNEKNQIILVETDNNGLWWGFPKGKIEKYENALSTAKREIFEETGIKNVRLIKKLNYLMAPDCIRSQNSKRTKMAMFCIQQQA